MTVRVMSLRPRFVTPAGAPEVAALMGRIAADHPTGFELSTTELVELLTTYPGVVVEGGWHGDELVAFTTLLPEEPRHGKHPFILFGDVDPARLGEGFGSLMLARALAAARDIHEHEAPTDAARIATRGPACREDRPTCSAHTDSRCSVTTS